jgi:ferredoxin
MPIVVDLNRCRGYAPCAPLALDTLRLSGAEALMYDPNPGDAQRLRVLRAAAPCPVQAIPGSWSIRHLTGAAAYSAVRATS